MLFDWLRRAPRSDAIQPLYERVAEASRLPALYLAAGVPDTVEGRLESLTLHTMLVTRRLAALPAPGPEIAQELTDRVFAHIDHGLRELGVGDVVVPKRMKKIAGNVHGRAQAYHGPLAACDAAALAQALARNVTEGADASALAAYALAAAERLDRLSADQILSEQSLFPERLP